MTNKNNSWDLKSLFLDKVKQNGGFVNCHAHFDRAFTINPKNLKLSQSLMEEKWTLVDKMKKNSSQKDFENRIEKSLKVMIAQGVKTCASFIDVDDLVELRAIKAAKKIQKKYQDKIKFLIINQTLKGLIDNKARKWIEKAIDQVNILGGLPSKDRPHHKKHLDILFQLAKDTGKKVHVHIDQENNPHENDTELLAKKTIEHGLEGRVIAIHSISIAAKPPQKRQQIYKLMKSAGISVVCCPAAALSMKPLSCQSYLHNSIAPVPELIEAGITVSLGVDNLADIYQPFIAGNLWEESRILMESCRYYDINNLVKIATTNGRKILSQ